VRCRREPNRSPTQATTQVSAVWTRLTARQRDYCRACVRAKQHDAALCRRIHATAKAHAVEQMCSCLRARASFGSRAACRPSEWRLRNQNPALQPSNICAKMPLTSRSEELRQRVLSDCGCGPMSQPFARVGVWREACQASKQQSNEAIRTGVRAARISQNRGLSRLQSSSCRVATRERRCTEPSHRRGRRRLSGPGLPDVVVVGSERHDRVLITLSSNSEMCFRVHMCLENGAVV